MTTANKFDKVMQCGLEFQIYNKPVQHDYLWDIKVFWREMQGTEILKNCNPKGFDDIDDCLDDMLQYLENHDKN